ncbi:MAG: hypothetical protein HY744_15765 [Deltaproteobacteria bacterium]|nr:hypothetical protein [Deltaproteobacteria bacterium]
MSPREIPQASAPSPQAGPPAEPGRALGLLVALLVLGVTMLRGASSAQWHGDFAAVRDQGLGAAGLGGTLSMLAAQALGLLPLGTRSFRASLGAALALGLGAYLLVGLGRRLLAAAGVPPRLAALASAVAALGAVLGPSWQRESTVGGGAVLAAALVLGALGVLWDLVAAEAPRLVPATGRRWLLVAILCGGALGESVLGGAALLVAALVGVALARKPPVARLSAPMLVACAGAAALFAAPALLHAYAPYRIWLPVGLLDAAGFSAGSLGGRCAPASAASALSSWAAEAGWLPLCLAALGLCFGALPARTRAPVGTLLVLLSVALVVPGPAVAVLGPSCAAVLRLLALAALYLGAALGVAAAALLLLRLQVPLGRAAAVLVVVFLASAVALSSEQGGFEADRSGQFAAEEWTDEALGALPPHAAVVVHSPRLAWRLWAAQIVQAERPDVAVVAAPLLRRAAAASYLLPAEPVLAPLVRDLRLVGRPSEAALAALADARPLYLELDPGFEARLVAHLGVDGPWLRFVPQAPAAADREPRRTEIFAARGRIVSAISSGGRDEDSAVVVAHILKEQAAVLSLFGMWEAARGALERLEHLSPRDSFATGARLRLAYAEQRRDRQAELRDLLPY